MTPVLFVGLTLATLGFAATFNPRHQRFAIWFAAAAGAALLLHVGAQDKGVASAAALVLCWAGLFGWSRWGRPWARRIKLSRYG